MSRRKPLAALSPDDLAFYNAASARFAAIDARFRCAQEGIAPFVRGWPPEQLIALWERIPFYVAQRALIAYRARGERWASWATRAHVEAGLRAFLTGVEELEGTVRERRGEREARVLQ